MAIHDNERSALVRLGELGAYRYTGVTYGGSLPFLIQRRTGER